MVFVDFRFVQIWIFLCSFSSTCLVAEKINIRQKIFFLGHRMGPEVLWPNGAHGARGTSLGPAKKIHLLIGPGSSRGSRLAGRARVWKNSARTRPVAILTYGEEYTEVVGMRCTFFSTIGGLVSLAFEAQVLATLRGGR